jgi:UDP-3-O-[3-hydroxymyristoyl] glucosamine N-acyltransferase
VIGGQVGIGDKARIESRAVLGSGSGVLTSKIVRAGQVVWGTPARPLKECLEQMAVLSRMAKKRRSQEDRSQEDRSQESGVRSQNSAD